MKIRTLFGALACATLAVLPLVAPAQNVDAASVASSAPSVNVTGQGRVERSPDRARVSLTIVTADKDAVRSGGANTTIYNAFLGKVAAFGVTAADVHTNSYDVAFVPPAPRDLPPDQRQPRYGYVTTRELSVVVSPLDAAGKIVDAATAAGVTQIGDVGFELKDSHGAELAAIASAVRDAREKAQTMATAAGVTLGRVRSITSSSDYEPQPMPRMAARATSMAAAAPPTQIAPSGPMVVTATVTVTYDVK